MRTDGRVTHRFTVSAILAVGALVFGGSALTACNNQLKDSTLQKKSSVAASSPQGAMNSSLIALQKVVKTQAAPTLTLDLIGDGTGQFGQLCTPSAGAAAALCQCTLTYTPPSGGPQAVNVNISYVESDLVRCPYSSVIPAGVLSWDIKLLHVATSTVSNSFSFTLDLSIDMTLNTQLPSTYVLARRYQCRDHVWIPHMMAGNVYDPIQSENTRVSYPLNFYTTSIARSILALYRESIDNPSFFSSWDCDLNESDSPFWRNPKIYSQVADSNGSRLIHPATGSASNRSTFYLARKKTSVFNVEVNAMHLPTVVTQTGADPSNPQQDPPIGYGARPIPLAGGGETCPVGQVQIPPGFQWVKVFAWRGDLVKRSYVASSNQFNGGNSLIACNPGNYDNSAGIDCSPAGNPSHPNCSVFADCGYNGTRNARALSSDNSLAWKPGIASTQDLASRVYWNTQSSAQVCGEFADGDAGRSIAYFGFQNFTAGTDLSQRWRGLASASIPFQMNSVTPFTVQWQNGVAHDTNLTINSSTIDNNQSRVDYLFVVTPISVMRSTLANPSAIGHGVYHPFTFKSKDDCDAVNPDDPTCVANSARVTHYQLWSTEVSANPDAPAEDPSRDPAFPICALQPIS